MAYTYTTSSTFTITQARYLTSKVSADMHLCSAYHGHPVEATIRDLAEEFAQLLKDGYVGEYEFGYKRNEKRVVSWRYTVRSDGTISSDDRPGRVLSSVDVDNADFYTYLWYSPAWSELSESERSRIEKALPVQRTTGDPPCDGVGYWTGVDKQYSSSSVGLSRATFRPY